MKNRKRLIVYSVLALPFVVFAGYMATLDPLARDGFFAEFKANTAEQFKASPTPAVETADSQPAEEGGSPGRGGGGRFEPSEMFARRDTNSDGKLTGDEISEWMQPLLAQIDTDGDGALTLEEMTTGMEQLRANRSERGGQQGRGGFDPAAFFARRDADNDGKLTGDEIDERMRENLDQIDTDQDGSISLEEFQARRRARTAESADGGVVEAADAEESGQSQRPE